MHMRKQRLRSASVTEYEWHHEETVMHMRKQRRRSASVTEYEWHHEESYAHAKTKAQISFGNRI